MSFTTFFQWLFISVYQGKKNELHHSLDSYLKFITAGGAIMMLAIWLFENEFLNVVCITFTALIFNELLMVALEIQTWYLKNLDDLSPRINARFPLCYYS